MGDPQEPIELTILMPCLNEADTLGACIRKAERFLKEKQVKGEIVVADNGSTDGSQQVALENDARLVHTEPAGYGNALMGGIAAARGKYVVMGDSDDSYDFYRIGGFLELLRAGYDLVMGNRYLGGIAPGAMPFLHRYLGNPILSWIGRLFFRTPVRDFHCGLRAFSREAVLGLNLQTTGMEFASEMVVKATLFGLRIGEVGTVLSPAGRNRPPHLRTWRDGWRHLRFLLLFSPRWLFLYPGLALMVIGMIGLALILPGPLELAGATLDVHTLLYSAAAVLLGYQAVSFAVFSEVFAITEGLRPEDPRLGRLFRHIRLETGLLVGGALAIVGLGMGVGVSLQWGASAFGPLEPTRSLRLVIPAVLLLVMGAQTVLNSFFLSVLGLRRHASQPTVKQPAR